MAVFKERISRDWRVPARLYQRTAISCAPHAKNKGVCPCRSAASTLAVRLRSPPFRNLSVPSSNHATSIPSHPQPSPAIPSPAIPSLACHICPGAQKDFAKICVPETRFCITAVLCDWLLNIHNIALGLTHQSILWQAPIKNGDVQRRNLCARRTSTSWAHVDSQKGNSMIPLSWNQAVAGKILFAICMRQLRQRVSFP